MRIFAGFIIILIFMPVFAQSRQSVVITDFYNTSRIKTSDHYSTIVPDNIRTELDRTGYYSVKRTVARNIELDEDGIKKAAVESNADYFITGEYTSRGGEIGVSAHVYVKNIDKVVTIVMEPKRVGVFLNEIIDNISLKIGFELQKYRDRSGEMPVIEPASSDFSYYAEIIISSPFPDMPVYYTLDGTLPGPGNGFRYSNPFTVYNETVVKAVSIDKEGVPSDVAVKNFRPLFVPSVFDFKILYGVMQFVSSGDDVESPIDTTIISVVPVFYLGGFDTFKKTAVARNLGFGGWFDFANADLDGGYQYKIQGYSGGVFLRFNPFNNLSLEIPFTVGKMRTSLIEEMSVYENIFSEPGDTLASDLETYCNSGIVATYRVSNFQFIASATMKYILSDDDPTKILVYQAGAGVCY
ncbi:MAG TPA: chitobiase/beta-hexosaminidase C-terminal domain-containing protein [Spirochaetota bacterium]|nr:chitobiase/beta-hexosaminidase C-terminal domain-containing protein [Spirochaetota bacterium]